MSGLWELTLMEGKNPSHTGQFLNSLDTREFTSEEVLAREGAQNAMDAGKAVKGITELEFHQLKISGTNKDKFIELFQFKEELGPRVEIFKQKEKDRSFASNLESFLESSEMSALLIRDKKTCGLGGAHDEYEVGDHFSRLVCALNLDDKSDDDPNLGGSFGLGKTTYARSSSILTVLYHSTFEPTKRSKGVGRRLMVAGVYPRHKFEGKEFGGFAYFGKPDPKDNKVAVPFEDQEAEDRWDQINKLFGKNLSRSNEDYGTDILILMSNLDIEQIRKAVEDYYFPALIDQQVNIKFYDFDGELSLPKPFAREDLDQFIRLMQDAKKGEAVKEVEKKEVAQFLKFNNYNLGTFAFEAAEPDEAGSEKNNCVAIMRGTGMIINYVKLGSEQFEPAVGAFIAHEDIYPFLQFAENPAHSEWEDSARRLLDRFPNEGQPLVKTVNKRLRDRFNKFQKQLQPDVTTLKSKTGLLASLLSKSLGGSVGDGRPDPGGPNPASISLTKKKREEHRSLWRLIISSNEHTPEEEFELIIYPTISLAGDAKLVPMKRMDLHVSDENGKILGRGSKVEIPFKFQKGKSIDLLVYYEDPGSKNYVVRCTCVAKLEETNE